MPVTKGEIAKPKPGPITVMTTAPIMMMIKHKAANGVRLRRILVMPGSTNPNAPSTSHTPMNYKNGPGKWMEFGGDIFSIASVDITSLKPPANRNHNDSST
jgi:hypothetical protein